MPSDLLLDLQAVLTDGQYLKDGQYHFTFGGIITSPVKKSGSPWTPIMLIAVSHIDYRTARAHCQRWYAKQPSTVACGRKRRMKIIITVHSSEDRSNATTARICAVSEGVYVVNLLYRPVLSTDNGARSKC